MKGKIIIIGLLFLYIFSIFSFAQTVSLKENQQKENQHNVFVVSQENTKNLNSLASQEEMLKQRYDKSKKEYFEVSKNFINNKECKECKKEKKVVLNKAVEVIFNNVAMTKFKVKRSPYIFKEEKSELISILNKREDSITSLKENILHLDDKSKDTEIIRLAKEIKNTWEETKEDILINTLNLADNKISYIITKSEQLSTKLDRIIENLDCEKETIEINSKIYKQHIKQAKTYYEESQLTYSRKDSEYNEEKISNSIELLRRSNHELQEANKILHKIIQEVRKNQRGIIIQ